MSLRQTQAFYFRAARSLAAGLPLVDIMAREIKILQNPLRQQLTLFYSDLRKGVGVGEAAQKRQTLFPGPYATMISLGEKNGNMAGAFQAMYQDCCDQRDFYGRLAMLAVYPLTLASAAVLLFPMTDAAHHWSRAQQGHADPGWLAVTNTYFSGVAETLLYALAAAAGVYAVYRYFRGKPALYRKKMLLKLPIVGEMLRLKDWSVFSQSMAVGLKAGLDMGQTLVMAAQATVNPDLIDHCHHSVAAVNGGSSLSLALAHRDYFPHAMLGEIEVAEQHGDLTAMFNHLHQDYRRRMIHRATMVSKISGYLLLVLAGALVAAVAASRYTGYLQSLASG